MRRYHYEASPRGFLCLQNEKKQRENKDMSFPEQSLCFNDQIV